MGLLADKSILTAMQSVEIPPVPAGERTQSATDLFLIFAGANIVATTLQVGATLAPAFRAGSALVLIALGSVAGALLVAALSPVGPRLGVPSVVAARAALGMRGAALVAILLYVTNSSLASFSSGVPSRSPTSTLPTAPSRAATASPFTASSPGPPAPPSISSPGRSAAPSPLSSRPSWSSGLRTAGAPGSLTRPTSPRDELLESRIQGGPTWSSNRFMSATKSDDPQAAFLEAACVEILRKAGATTWA